MEKRMTLQQKRQGRESGLNKGACAFPVTEITARPHIPTLVFMKDRQIEDWWYYKPTINAKRFT